MSLRGITLHPACEGFFSEAYGIKKTGEVAGIPVYQDAEKRLFAGGYNNMYTVTDGNQSKRLKELASWRKGKSFVRYGFSTEEDMFGAKRTHFMLRIPATVTSLEEVRGLYKSKTRNQVRKSERLIEDVREEARPAAFYELYCASIRRLGSVPRPEAWFECVERHFGEDVYTVNAYHEGKLIGSNFYIRSGDYALLLFNVSDETYWHLDVNNRVYDAYIQNAIKHGVKCIDLGPSGGSHAHFKLGFGATVHYMADQLYAGFLLKMREHIRIYWPRIQNRFKLPSFVQ